jgi:5'-nucleotidase
MRRVVAAWILATAALLSVLASTAIGAPKKPTVDVQLLAINDFHGNLQPPTGSGGTVPTPDGPVLAGGVAYLATHMHMLEAENPGKTLIVGAGDLIGASPLLSAMFHDEPTIEAMNALGMDVSAVGNHEFDEGYQELLRMQNGGCHPVDGCLDGDPFAGAAWPYLSANVFIDSTGDTLFPAYVIKKFQGARIALIGMTLEDTPTIVTPAGVAGLTFKDEVKTANRIVRNLRKTQGIHTFVILLHQGGQQNVSPAFVNNCDNLTGPIVDIANGLDRDVDVIASAHTHQAYNCTIDGKLVTQAASFGRLITQIKLSINRNTDQVVSKSAVNHIVTRDVAPDDAETALIAKYDAIAGPIGARPVGTITATLDRTPSAAGETTLGDVIADAQLEAASTPENGSAVIAFMNPGGVRADLTYPSSSAGEGDGVVTYAEAFTVQPFTNYVDTMSLTGADIEHILEQQFDNPSPGANRILSVSSNLHYAWNPSAPVGDRIDPASITINGTPLDLGATYRVAENSFLATGGDNFTGFTAGTDLVTGPVDLDALIDYFAAHSPVAPPPSDRISLVGG